MSDNGESEKRRLTLDDPVPADQIKSFEELATSRAQVADNLLRLEQDKIFLLATARRIDDQHKRLFQALLTERGIAPGTPCEVDGKTGKLKFQEDPPAAPPEDPAAPPAEVSSEA